jgi:hypothetical protein
VVGINDDSSSSGTENSIADSELYEDIYEEMYSSRLCMVLFQTWGGGSSSGDGRAHGGFGISTTRRVVRWARMLDGTYDVQDIGGYLAIRPSSRDHYNERIRHTLEHVPFTSNENTDYYFDPALDKVLNEVMDDARALPAVAQRH